MRIQNNMLARNTVRQYNIANSATAGYTEKLSSGYRINRSGDDAAGLAISEKMRAQIRGLSMASKNSQDAVSLIQTAEGALQSTHNILQRMRELAVQAASDTNEQVIDRGALDQEYQALKAEIDEIAHTTRFNDQNLIDGTFQQAHYSTDITYSQLTAQTTADVSRVGVKSNHNMHGAYNIGVQYIRGQDAVEATRSGVNTQVEGPNRILLSADKGTAAGGTSIIRKTEFEAVVGAKHNGKTFTLSASGSGSELFDASNGLKVSMTDGDTVYKGTVVATDRMNGGSTVTVNFDGVGTLTLQLDADIQAADKDVYNIASSLNTKQIKFEGGSSGVVFSGGTYEADPTRYVVSAKYLNDPGFKNASMDLIPINTTGSLRFSGDSLKVLSTGVIVGKVDVIVDGISKVKLNRTDIKANDFAFDESGFADDDGFLIIGLEHSTKTAEGHSLFYGSYAFTLKVTKGSSISTVQEALHNAVGSIEIDITKKTGIPYNVETRFDMDSIDMEKFSDTVLSITEPELHLNDSSQNNIMVMTSNMKIAIRDKDGQITNPKVSASFHSKGSFDDDVTLTFAVEDYGTFKMFIPAHPGRDKLLLEKHIKEALKHVSLSIGSGAGEGSGEGSGGGSDGVKKVDPQIALSLNGEVVTLGQNDTKATFDSSGVSLSFNPIDLAGVTDSAGATALFTGRTDPGNTISIRVEESEGKSLIIQSGANQGDELNINIDAMDLRLLGLTNSSIATQKSASRAITEVNNAINQVSTQRAALGALQNRLSHKIANLDTSTENLQAAEGRIRDTDMAKIMTHFTKSNILGQAATAMLAQANSQPQNVLQLLG